MRLVLIQPALRAGDSAFNCRTIEELVRVHRASLEADDVLVLPEHFTFDDDPSAYDAFVRSLARLSGCTVIGGSHHRLLDGGRRVNYGSACDAAGNVIGTYTKRRPYFHELSQVAPGDAFGEFTVAGRNVLVLICADFWYADLLLGAVRQPDLILVPSLSVSRKSGPGYSRSLWRHLAVARAYEFGAFVGISDWGEDARLLKYRTCGVGGLADPTVVDPESFFRPVPAGRLGIYPLDFGALEAFRRDRKERGFFWK
jgi:predicted amidohydrolase